jgi:hypothetical protein
VIVAAAILLYLGCAMLLGRRLRRQATPAPRPQLERVDQDEQLDITPALRRSR